MNRVMTAALAGALTLFLSAQASAAQTIRVDFDLANWFPNLTDFDGSFVASDLNEDGLISRNEVTDFRNNALGAATLLAFGDFDIGANTWTTDNSAHPGDYYVLTTGMSTYYDGLRPETTISSVPEPVNALLMGSAVAGLALFSRRRRKA